MIDYLQLSSAKDRFVWIANSVQFVDGVVACCNQFKFGTRVLLLFGIVVVVVVITIDGDVKLEFVFSELVS